jgi:hypothetical protein
MLVSAINRSSLPDLRRNANGLGAIAWQPRGRLAPESVHVSLLPRNDPS